MLIIKMANNRRENIENGIDPMKNHVKRSRNKMIHYGIVSSTELLSRLIDAGIFIPKRSAAIFARFLKFIGSKADFLLMLDLFLNNSVKSLISLF